MKGLLLLCLVIAGCSGADVVNDASPPNTTMSYEDVVRQRLELAAGETTHQLRFNPTGCRCPAFEIRLSDQWQRVALSPDDPESEAMTALMTAIKVPEPEQLGRTYEVGGTLREALSPCGAGALYVTLEPSEFLGVRLKTSPENAP